MAIGRGVPTSAKSAPVSAALADLVRRGALSADPLQAKAATVLDGVAAGITNGNGRLFGRRKPVRGAYLVGAVGRGKTMLMDRFFAAAPVTAKRRVHFDEFMDELHQAITAFRKGPRGKAENADPIAAVTRPIVEATRLICLDEFQVTDITNAMLLGRLFEKLFAGGVTLVATSNTLPDDLYRDGLNRPLFLPFIEELKTQVEVVRLDGPTDYRRLKLEGEEVYRFGTGPEVRHGMDRLWLKLCGGVQGKPDTVHSLGRDIVVPEAAMGAARFGFAALCDTPLGARDYLRIAHAYDALMIDGVPAFTRGNASAAKRFILLVDTLYDRGLRLAASFAVPLDELGQESRLAGELQRTVSRLVEMQSTAYLEAAHKPL
ncbi:MAG: cell division protein ZapE [Devosia nanyangense]|uniref:Cell division protein ZapE n=1 Tax=Devosia nanyangense TaxID=1228055 RepID=A0A933L229_9HYPH|nr:cell division protein ZapE [Devosia nanyangense]